MFFIILFSVLRHGSKKDGKEGKLQKLVKKAIITIVLVVMFGVGWIFGILGSSGIPVYISYPCQIVFVVVVGFQGLLIFIFYPCRSKDAREEWKKWSYYVTCRRNTYNELLKLSKQSVAKSGEHSSTAFTTDKGVKKRVSEQSISSSASALAAKFGYKRDRSVSIDSESSVVSSETSSSTLTGRRLLKQDTIALAVLNEEDEDYNNIIAEETVYLDSNFVSSAEAASAQELPKEAKVKPIVKQMLVFENSNTLITFEDDENEQPSVSGIDNDHDQFSHENLYFLENPGASEENVPDGLITWHTVDEEEDGVAETIFCNFEDDM